jgi:hypothetical protein
MSETFAAQPAAPPETQDPNLPVQSAAPASQNILELPTTTTQAPQEIPEWGDDRNYDQHWGINE